MKTFRTLVVVAALAGAQSMLAMQEGDASCAAQTSESTAATDPGYFSAGVVPVFVDHNKQDAMKFMCRRFSEVSYVAPGGQEPDFAGGPLKQKNFHIGEFNTVRQEAETDPWQTAQRAFQEQTGMALPSDVSHNAVHVKMIAIPGDNGQLMHHVSEFDVFSRKKEMKDLIKEASVARGKGTDSPSVLPESFGGRRADHYLFFARVVDSAVVAAYIERVRQDNSSLAVSDVDDWWNMLRKREDAILAGDSDKACKAERLVNTARDGIADPAYPLVAEEIFWHLPDYPRQRAFKILKVIKNKRAFDEAAFGTKHEAAKTAYYGTAPLDLATSRVRSTKTLVPLLRPECTSSLGASGFAEIFSLAGQGSSAATTALGSLLARMSTMGDGE